MDMVGDMVESDMGMRRIAVLTIINNPPLEWAFERKHLGKRRSKKPE